MHSASPDRRLLTLRILSSHVALVGVCLAVTSAARADNFRQTGTVQLVLDPQGYRTRVADLDFSPDGALLAAAGEKEVRLYDVQSGQLVRTLRGDRSEGEYGDVYAVAFSPDGRELLVGIVDTSDAGAIRVYDTRNFDEIKQLVSGTNITVRRLAFSRDGRWLVAAGENGNLFIYDWPARKIVKTIPPQRADQPIFDALMFPGKEPVLLAFPFGGPRLYSIPDGREFTSPQGLPPDLIGWMGMVMGGQMTYPKGAGQTPPQIWDVTLDRGYWLIGGQSKLNGSPEYWAGVIPNRAPQASVVYDAHSFSVSAVAASPVGDLAASADVFGEIHLWNRRTGQPVREFQSLSQKVYEAAFDASGTRIAYGNAHFRGADYKRNQFGRADLVFDLAKRTLGDANFVAGLAPQTERTQLGDYRIDLQQVEGATHLVATRAGRETGRYRLPAGTNPMCYTLLERHGFDVPHPVIYGVDNGTLAAWNADSDRLLRAYIGHGNFVTSIGASPDGRLLVSSATDGEICVWPLGTRQPTGHPDFERQSDVVMRITPGSSSQQAGVQVGDRLITLDGKSVTEMEELLLQGKWTYRPGQQVPVVMERAGRRYPFQMTLADGPDFVEPLLHLFVTADREWILWTQQGYYDCSPGADRFIGWQKNRGPDKSAEFHAVQQFRKQLYRPDVIDQVIKLGNVSQAIAAANAAQGRGQQEIDLRDPVQFEKLQPPQVTFLAPEDGLPAPQPQIKVRVRVSSSTALPVRDVTFLLDGVPAHVAHPNGGAAGAAVDVEADLTLRFGTNKVSVIASNGQTTSPAVERKFVYRGAGGGTTRPAEPKPNLFVLAIGVARYAHAGEGFSDLQFADRDASEFAKAVEAHRDGRIYGKIESKVITNADATKVNILDGFDWLVKKCHQGDIAMIFISAHGFRDDKQNFYLATHDVQLDKLRATAVSWAEITRALQEDLAPCKRYMFLDTCHSGGIAQGQVVYDPVHDVVAPEVGTIVFTSCQPREESQERGDWKHGAFTYALMQTLRDAASDTLPLPAGGDKQFFQTELSQQVYFRVKDLTKDAQHPWMFTPPGLSRESPVLQVLAD